MIHTISRAVLLGCASLLAAGAAQAQTPPSHSHTPADEAEGRRYTVDDMLAVEAFGKATLDPSGRKVVFERLAAHEQLIRYDLGYYSPYTASTLWVADVGAGTARPLLPPSADHGLKIGAWSPSGRWLLVHRIGAEAWDAGVVEVETGAVRWLNLHPESEAFGRTLQWRSDDELIAIHRPRGGFAAQAGAQPTALEAARKRRAAGVTGRFSGTRLGAGAFAEEPLAESNEIVAINVATGTRRTLASGRFLDLELSPDGGWLAALEIGAAPPLDLDRPVHGLERPNARRLHLVEISTGERIPLCETCNPAASLMSWSPDGRRLLIWDRTSPDPDRGRLLALTPADDALEVFALGDLTPGVEPDAGLHDMIRAHWIGDRPAIRARRSGDARRDWWLLTPEGSRNLSEALPLAPGRLEAVSGTTAQVLSGGRIWLLSADGAATPTSPEGLSLSAFTSLDSFDPPRLRLNAPVAGTDFVVACSGGGLTVSAAPECEAASSPARRVSKAGSTSLSLDQVADRRATRLDLRGDGQIRSLATINGHLNAIAFADPIAVPHADPKGSTINSWLYLPPHRGTDRLPMVVIVYPGSARPAQTDPATVRAEVNVQLFAAAGYAVLVASVPRTRDTNEPAEGMADQILSAVDAALAQHPELDGDRLALTGHSFGGYTALVVATQTDRFRSIIAAASISNLSEKWGEGSPLNQADPANGGSRRHWVGQMETGPQTSLGGSPWEVPDRYQRNSPLFAADRVSTPILLIHGDQDSIPIGQAQSMFTALWRQNKDVRLLTYWGEGHAIKGAENMRDVVRQQMAWLEQTVAPYPLTAGVSPSDEPRPRPPGRD